MSGHSDTRAKRDDASATTVAATAAGWPAEDLTDLTDDPHLIRAEIWSIERRFRLLGVPTFQQTFNTERDVFSPALPMLVVAFVIQMLLAFDLVFKPVNWWWFVAPLIAGILIATGLVLLGNIARGDRFFSWPKTVGWLEIALFVLLPTAVDWLGGDGWRGGLVTMSQQVVILVLAWLIFALGFVPIVLWTGQRFLGLLKTSGRILVKAVPLMILFSFLLFFTEEIWSVFGMAGPLHVGLATILFALVAGFFVGVHVPGNIDKMQDAEDGPPLDRLQRINVGILVFLTLALQVVFVGMLVFVFFMALGAVLMPTELTVRWTHTAIQTWRLGPLTMNDLILRVAGGVALISALYYSVAMWLDDMYRDDVLDQIAEEMRPTFKMRTRYQALLERRDALPEAERSPTALPGVAARMAGRPGAGT